MQEVVITGYLRTAQTRSRPKDPAKDLFGRVRSEELLARLIPELIKRTGIDAAEIDDFVVGCATGVGEQWTYGGRFPLFLANLPDTIASKFVDQQCGSSMAGAHIGFMEIATGNAQTVLVGGMEHMTRIPMSGETFKAGLVSPNPALLKSPEYRHKDMQTALNMGLTAQKLFSLTDFTRRDMDEWAFRSHQLAAKAQKQGFFDGEIMPIETEQADGSVKTVDRDQAVRNDTTLEELAGLKAAFKEGHEITAGNSSPLNAGATSMILMSKEKARSKGIKPLATVRSIGFAGVDPTIMGAGTSPREQESTGQCRACCLRHRFLGNQRSLLHRGLELYERAGHRSGKSQCDGRWHRDRPCVGSYRDSPDRHAGSHIRHQGRQIWLCERMRGRRTRRSDHH